MGNAQSPTENLSGNKAIEKIKSIAETARTCFLPPILAVILQVDQWLFKK